MKFLAFLAFFSYLSAAQAGSDWTCSYALNSSRVRVKIEYLANNSGGINDFILILRQSSGSTSSVHNFAIYSPEVKKANRKDAGLMRNWIGVKYKSPDNTRGYDLDFVNRRITFSKGQRTQSAPLTCQFAPGGE